MPTKAEPQRSTVTVIAAGRRREKGMGGARTGTAQAAPSRYRRSLRVEPDRARGRLDLTLAVTVGRGDVDGERLAAQRLRDLEGQRRGHRLAVVGDLRGALGQRELAGGGHGPGRGEPDRGDLLGAVERDR